MKLGLNIEDIDMILNSFICEPVNYQQLEKKCQEGVKKVDESTKEKNLLIFSLLQAITEV